MSDREAYHRLHDLHESLPALSRDLNRIHRSLQDLAEGLLAAGRDAGDPDLADGTRGLYSQAEAVGNHLVDAQRELLATSTRLQGILRKWTKRIAEEEHGH